MTTYEHEGTSDIEIALLLDFSHGYTNNVLKVIELYCTVTMDEYCGMEIIFQ